MWVFLLAIAFSNANNSCEDYKKALSRGLPEADKIEQQIQSEILAKVIQSAKAPDEVRIEQDIRNLSSNHFRVRQAARESLASFGISLLKSTRVQEALNSTSCFETYAQLSSLLDEITKRNTPRNNYELYKVLSRTVLSLSALPGYVDLLKYLQSHVTETNFSSRVVDRVDAFFTGHGITITRFEFVESTSTIKLRGLVEIDPKTAAFQFVVGYALKEVGCDLAPELGFLCPAGSLVEIFWTIPVK